MLIEKSLCELCGETIDLSLTSIRSPPEANSPVWKKWKRDADENSL